MVLFQTCSRILPQSIAEHSNGTRRAGFTISRPGSEVPRCYVTVVLNRLLSLSVRVLTCKCSNMPCLKSTHEIVYVKAY